MLNWHIQILCHKDEGSSRCPGTSSSSRCPVSVPAGSRSPCLVAWPRSPRAPFSCTGSPRLPLLSPVPQLPIPVPLPGGRNPPLERGVLLHPDLLGSSEWTVCFCCVVCHSPCPSFQTPPPLCAALLCDCRPRPHCFHLCLVPLCI